MFFSSFVLWIGPLPLPGGYILLGLLSLGLSLKFFLKSRWAWRKAGVILAHLGALILLVGGLVTALAAHESFMILPEGAESRFVYDYTQRDFVVYEDQREILRVPFQDLEHLDARARTAGLPFAIKLKNICANCKIVSRAETEEGFEEGLVYHSMAKGAALVPEPQGKEPEEDMPGLSFVIEGAGKSENGDVQDGYYVAFDSMPKVIAINSQNKNYQIVFGKRQSQLPFSVTLKDFVKDSYSGMEMARDYHSDVIIRDGDLVWPVRIGMNEPLRYQGYTLFQSSFQRTPDAEMSIFAVVENKGWLVPYIGTFVIGAGLILHLISVLLGWRRS